jgi:hypothetical protein
VAKCPACGFESPDPAQWCDLCKEPFRNAPPAADPEGARKALPGQGIPPEFLALDTGGKIPHAPPWLRYAAWSILAAWFVVVMALLGAYLSRQDAQQQGRPAGQPPQTR